MKKFTKVILIIAAVLASLGILFCGIAAVMGAGWSTIHRKALAGEFDFGNWHIGNGIYYSNDDWKNSADWEDDAVSAYETNETGESSEAENGGCVLNASDVQSLELEIANAAELVFDVSDDADKIIVTVENGVGKYFSVRQEGLGTKVIYDRHGKMGDVNDVIKVLLPAKSDKLEIDAEIGVGNVTFTQSAMQLFSVDISVGVGNISVGDIALGGTAEFETGTGNVLFEGQSFLELTAESGIGNVEVNLPGTEDDYYYNISAGMGNITFNDETIGSFAANKVYGNAGAGALVELEAGMGDITVTTAF